MSLKERLHSWTTHRVGATDLLLSIINRSCSAPLAFVGNIIIARLLGPEKFGIYITMISVALVAGGVAAYGIGPVLTREISAVDKLEKPFLLNSLINWALRFATLSSLVVMSVTMTWLFLGYGLPLSSWPERISTVSIIPLSVLSSVVVGVLAGLSMIARSQAIGTVLKNGSLLIGVLLISFMGLNHPIDVLLVQAVSFGLPIIIAIYWIKGYTPISINIRKDWLKQKFLSKSKEHYLRRSARHFLAISLSWLFLWRLDVVIVNAVAGSLQAGLFGAASRLGQISAIAGLIWVAWLQPRVSSHFSSKNYTALYQTMKIGVFGSVGMTIVLVIAGWLAAPILIRIMGKEFSGAIAPFRWILIAHLLWAASIPFYAFLSMSGKESILSKILWIQFLITLIMSLPLAYYFGALGGSWAWGSGLGIGSIMITAAGIFYMRNFSYYAKLQNHI